MLRSYVQNAGTQLSQTLFRILDHYGIQNAEEDSENAAAAPWYSRVYRRFTATYGTKLPYMIFALLIFFLYGVAVMAAANEVILRKIIESKHNLRGSADEPSSTDKDASGNAPHSGKSSSVSFLFSMFVSFLFWLTIIQVFRFMQRVAALRYLASNPTEADGGRRDSFQILTQLMQSGRVGTAGANRLRMALLERDFTGDDYEMLQELDDSPRAQHGATQEQIDRLPLHAITTDELGEHESTPGGAPTCNICLGPYEVNDEVRTVPCMHKFHRHCIDTWLRDRASCPVCKYRAVA